MSKVPSLQFVCFCWVNQILRHEWDCRVADDMYELHISCCWLCRPVKAHFLMRFSHRHSVFLCIFYHVYHGFVWWGGVGWGGMITFMLRVMHNALRC